MRTFLKSLGVAVIAYALGALAGYALVRTLSSNVHDKSVEAGMTGAFVSGPLAAVVAFLVALVVFSRRKSAGSAP